MKLVLLDRNIISDIRKFNSGTRTHDFSLAKSVDLSGNFVSPLMSIIEGRFRNPQSYLNMYDTLNDETEEVEKFYKIARTDSRYLQSNFLEVITAFAKKTEDDVDRYSPFVKYLQLKLADPVAEEKASMVQEEILEYAKENFYAPAHPVTICGLACLHSNPNAQKVLKPKRYLGEEGDFAAYNALLDILIATQLAYVRSMHSKSDSTCFLTRDTGLKNFLSQLRVIVKKRSVNRLSNEEIIAYNADLNIGLFPSLLKYPKRYQKLIGEIAAAQLDAGVGDPQPSRIALALRRI